MSNLVKHAKQELERLDDGSDMQKHVTKDILDIIEIFSGQGHSGTSASYVTGIVERLMKFKPLQPLTGEVGEWNQVDTNLEQNNRYGSVFRLNRDNDTAVESFKDKVKTIIGKVEEEENDE